MSIRHSRFAFCTAFAVFAAGLAVAPVTGAVETGAIKIDDAWVRESPIGSSSGGGYMRIVNTGKEADRLLSAASPVAASIVLKHMSYVGETLQVREASGGIEIPPGGRIQLRWEAYHLLFVGLKEPFKLDQSFEASLNFEKAGRITVQFGVRPRVYW